MKTGEPDAVISDVARRYLRLQLTMEVGPIRLRNLITRFGSIDAVLSASMSQLEGVAGIGPTVAGSIFKARGDGEVDREIDRAHRCGLRIVCVEDPDYPQPLRNITDPPICLYVRGRLEPTDSVAIAIVGTRRCSHYGREQAIRFGRMLGGAGFTVVSGLARGIDSYAHRGALEGGGRTIAVLGNGLGSVYPREHESLAEEIVGAGAVVSELPVDAQPAPENFPRRNRIIAGLSLGVLVIEAGRKSGALITARLATEYNREAFALPGRVDQPELTAGVNGMIRDGQAKLVTCLEDVLDELSEVGRIMCPEASASSESGGETADSRPPHGVPTYVGTTASVPVHADNLNVQERAVFTAIVNGAEDAEAIVCQAGLDMGRVTSTLTALQLKGLVRRLPGNRFVRRMSQ